MGDDQLFTWLTQATPGQFLLGILVLVFGSRQILSEKSVSESFGGLAWPFKVLRRRRERAAKDEASEIEYLRADVARLDSELKRYHRWSVSVTRWVRRLELWAAERGLSLPEPPFVHLSDFESRKEKDD